MAKSPTIDDIIDSMTPNELPAPAKLLFRAVFARLDEFMELNKRMAEAQELIAKMLGAKFK